MKYIITLILALALLINPSLAGAKEKKAPKGLKQIDMKYQWGMLKYSSGETKLNSYNNLKTFIDMAGDAESSAMIDKALKMNKTSMGFSFVGSVGVGWGLATVWWGHDKHWNDPEVSWPLYTGLAIGFIGDVIRNNASTKQFDAVQRYNRVARGDEKISFNIGMKDRLACAGLSLRF